VQCDAHGLVDPLLRPAAIDYQHWAELLELADMPVYLPWPLGPGWQVADFAAVPRRASVMTAVGESTMDGPVSVQLIAEEPGVGVGARCSGITDLDVLGQLGTGGPAVRLQVDGRSVPLWSVDAPDSAEVLSDARFVGEAAGRWLWLLIRPASAAMLLQENWFLADASRFGPQAVELPFGGDAPSW
jgi:hypothetical protein